MRLTLALLLAFAAQAQQPPPARPEFEVVSVKPGDPARLASGMTLQPGRLILHNATLKTLILQAFRISEYQIAGGPNWTGAAKFDIVAKLPAGAPMNQSPAMMQTMLEDRFRLRTHRETRQVREYALVLAPGGPKFESLDENDHQGAGSMTSFGGGAGEILGRGKTAPELAAMLVDAVEAPVVDRTGLTGKYDFHLKYAPVSTSPDADPAVLTIFGAVQKLGLKLNAIKGPVEVLVIDHAEMPSVN
ncbi:MAG TPA: TIGR03435 family protein [Bryobacteraceae bacterium]|nr:TIGR03435 family protein [Bryobacteraceae bacterium]